MSESANEGRVACVELPALPLQLLLREHPSWRELPVAVVEADRPQAKLLWVNEHARALRVLPGMRFAAARSLAGSLRAAVVDDERVAALEGELFTAMLEFSPRVEPAATGTFYIDPGGMVLLWGRLDSWASALQAKLAALGFESSIVVGFHRFRTHAIARTRSGAWVLDDRHAEARMAAGVALDRLELPTRLRDELAGLGVRTLGQFLALPGAELRLRFGREAELLHRRASDGHFEVLQARAPSEPIVETLALEPPESDLARLLFVIKPLLERLLERLAARGMAMSALRLRLRFERITWPDAPPEPLEQRIEPAAPTLECRPIVELLRLRFDAISLPSAIDELELELVGQHVDARQIALFRTQTRRDLDAADRALARLRASLGPEAVTRASLRAAHLPEARFTWTPIQRTSFPAPERMKVEGQLPPRLRRLLHRPERLPARLPREQDGWIIEPELGPVVALHGPFRASGGWWVREIERDYYYVETREGAILWVFYDRMRRRWYLHGRLD